MTQNIGDSNLHTAVLTTFAHRQLTIDTQTLDELPLGLRLRQSLMKFEELLPLASSVDSNYFILFDLDNFYSYVWIIMLLVNLKIDYCANLPAIRDGY